MICCSRNVTVCESRKTVTQRNNISQKRSSHYAVEETNTGINIVQEIIKYCKVQNELHLDASMNAKNDLF